MSFGCKGLNIVEATHVLLVEPSLNIGAELQAIGRVHRLGQTKLELPNPPSSPLFMLFVFVFLCVFLFPLFPSLSQAHNCPQVLREEHCGGEDSGSDYLLYGYREQ